MAGSSPTKRPWTSGICANSTGPKVRRFLDGGFGLIGDVAIQVPWVVSSENVTALTSHRRMVLRSCVWVELDRSAGGEGSAGGGRLQAGAVADGHHGDAADPDGDVGAGRAAHCGEDQRGGGEVVVSLCDAKLILHDGVGCLPVPLTDRRSKLVLCTPVQRGPSPATGSHHNEGPFKRAHRSRQRHQRHCASCRSALHPSGLNRVMWQDEQHEPPETTPD